MFNQFLVNRFQSLSRGHFNGQLNVESESVPKKNLFFSQGQLIWVAGGSHPVRRWRRHLIQKCPEAINLLKFREEENVQSWDYYALTVLLKRQQITHKQVTAIISDTIAEVLFDIIQQGSGHQLSYSLNKQKVLQPTLTLINTEEALKQANEAWEAWRNAGLAELSPNLAPVLRQPEQLQQQTSPAVYQNFVNLINGNNTLRDLAVQMNQDLLLLTRSLVPYIRKKIIGFVEVSDLPPLIIPQPIPKVVTPTENIKPEATSSPKGPLIACVDDSPQTCQIMEQIFKAAGFRFVSIQDSVQALPVLIGQKPDLIFLDLMMPVVNGYEICSQLRRVSVFANTPIIILTGSDGLVDRVRAKVVGASDFLGKPVEAQKVLSVVRKYLSATAQGGGASKLQLSESSVEMS